MGDTILTRRELYEAVWGTPLTLLAREYGVSDVGLKTICVRAKAPTPERGYWAKKEAGKPVTRRPLPKAANVPAKVSIHGYTAPALSDIIQEAQATARARIAQVSSSTMDIAAKGDGPPPSKGSDAAPSETPTGGHRPLHPIAVRLAKALERARPDAFGFVAVKGEKVPGVTLGAGSKERFCQLLDRLARQAEALDWSVSPSGSGLAFSIDGEYVNVSITEKVARVPHVATEKEVKEQARALARGWGPGKLPAADPSPSGLLTMEIQENAYGPLTRRYTDLKKHPIEQRLDEAFVTIAAYAALKAENRRKAEEAARIDALRAAERKREEAFAGREKHRLAFIDQVAEALEERDKLNAVAEHLRTIGCDDHRALQEMAQWVAFRLAAVEDILSQERLDISISASKVKFAEPSDPVKQAESPYYYPDPVLAHWRVEEAAGVAHRVSVRTLGIGVGKLPIRGEAPQKAEDPDDDDE